MRKLFYVFFIATVMVATSCGSKDKKEPADDDMEDMTKTEQTDETGVIAANTSGGFGVEITKEGAVDVKQFVSNPGMSSNYTGKISGTVTDRCKAMGCWVTLDMGNGESMMVEFRDDQGGEFFVPKDYIGKNIVVNGKMESAILSVEEQKHLAEDAGKDASNITTEKKQLVFTADGAVAL